MSTNFICDVEQAKAAGVLTMEDFDIEPTPVRELGDVLTWVHACRHACGLCMYASCFGMSLSFSVFSFPPSARMYLSDFFFRSASCASSMFLISGGESGVSVFAPLSPRRAVRVRRGLPLESRRELKT